LIFLSDQGTGYSDLKLLITLPSSVVDQDAIIEAEHVIYSPLEELLKQNLFKIQVTWCTLVRVVCNEQVLLSLIAERVFVDINVQNTRLSLSQESV